MTKTLEYFFDFISPMTYVATAIIPGVVERTGAELVYRPMFLGGVMQASGNRPPATVPAKGQYMLAELMRITKRYDLPLHFNPHFPMMNTRPLTGALLRLADNRDLQEELYHVGWKLVWGSENPIDTGNEASLVEALNAEGLDGAKIWALGTEPETKSMLRANTEEAAKRGAFGTPTFFVDGEMFFGHDRLDYVEDALSA